MVLLCSAVSVISSDVQHGYNADRDRSLQARAKTEMRTVSLVASWDVSGDVVETVEGRFPQAKFFLEFAGTESQNTIRVDMVKMLLSKYRYRKHHIAIVGVDMGSPQIRAQPGLVTEVHGIGSTSTARRYVFNLGQVSLRNDEVINPATGRGIVFDTWSRDPVFQEGKHSGYAFVRDLVQNLGLVLPSEVDRQLRIGFEVKQKVTPPNASLVTMVQLVWFVLRGSEYSHFAFSIEWDGLVTPGPMYQLPKVGIKDVKLVPRSGSSSSREVNVRDVRMASWNTFNNQLLPSRTLPDPASGNHEVSSSPETEPCSKPGCVISK
ncbi:MAG: hypothetical protein M1833_002093 [Piccolia ochrophora]|nr:MAG: hypothetical protein M1833_002093 [Piccolia ochrophora]